MESLKLALDKVLADTFVMYFKTHTFHWNVEGVDFKQYHDLFGGLYDELFGACDAIAEHIRAIDSYTPISLTQLAGYSMIAENSTVLTHPAEMTGQLVTDNNLVLVSLMRAYKEAEAASELGLANFLQDRIDIHNKHGWMLKASSK